MSARWVYVGDPSGPLGKGGAAQVLAVHAALLPIGAAGKIVYFSGSQWVEPTTWESIENEPGRARDPSYPAAKREIDHSRLFDCTSHEIRNPGSPDADLFCSGHAFLPDGRLMIAGGTQHYFLPAESSDPHHAHWSGSRETWIFDPFAAVRAAVGSPVTAVWAPRQPEHLDLFMTGTDGTVWSTWWEDATGWQAWFPVHPEVKAQPGATVTAVWAPRQPEHLDLFMTGPDGAIWSTWWEDATGWQAWFPVHPEPGVKAGPGATVTALWRGQHLDLFLADRDGTVWSTWWESAPNWQPWLPIHPEPGVKAGPGATVTAVLAPRRPDHVDLFMTDRDGTVWSTWWESAPNWQAWFPVHPEPGVKAGPGVSVTALWAPRQPDHLDLFLTGPDGAVWSTWWESAPNWQAWSLILQGPPWEQGPLLNRDPAQVEASPDGMGGGRWYPTLITLADGRVIAMCGHPLISQFTGNLVDFDARHNNTKPEIFDARTNTWTLIDKPLGVDGAHNFAPYYPRLFVVPRTGEVFCVQPLYSSLVRDYDPVNPLCFDTTDGGDGLCTVNPLDTTPPYVVPVKDRSLFYDVATHEVTRAFLGPQAIDAIYLDPGFTSQETTSVLLPLLHEESYHPRVLVCGGVEALIADLAPPSRGPVAPPPSPSWKVTAPRPLNTVRNYANCTLLPTGDVVLTGGVTKGIGTDHYTEADGVRTVEIYHPPGTDKADSWSLGPVARETRGYHSVALLMPDGRVWTAGSEWNAGATPNLAIELLEPDYIAVRDRAVVTGAPGRVGYGQSFAVHFRPTTTNTPIGRVAFMRLGSATHSFDGDQRYVGVPFTQAGNQLTVTAPPDATVAPPGYYMLWLLDEENLPSKSAPFVRVGPD